MSNEKENSLFLPVQSVIENIRPAQWLVKSYLEQETLSLVFGDPASGKSFVAIDMACCVATGQDWHGNSVEKAAVFYIAGEGHNGLGRRLKAWEIKNDTSLDDASLFLSRAAASLSDHEEVDRINEAIKDLSERAGVKPALIVVDTLARNFGGGDENSTRDMGEFIKQLDLIKAQWGVSILIVHHSGHADKNRARGATALKGALDHEYKVEKDNQGIISMECKKTKDGPNPSALEFCIESVELPLLDEDGQNISGAALSYLGAASPQTKRKLSGQKARARQILLNCLVEKGQNRLPRQGMTEMQSVTIQEFKDALKIENIVNSDDPDNVRRSISRIVTDLTNCGITGTYGDYIWLADKQDKAGRTET